MKTVFGCMSDLHGHWENYENYINSSIEVLIIAGDICRSISKEGQESEIKTYFMEFLRKFLNLKLTIIVPGNHDRWAEDEVILRNIKEISTDIIILVEECVMYNNIKIYGTPYVTIEDCNPSQYAFIREKGSKYQDIERIPKDLNILITHDSPRDYELPCIDYAKNWYIPYEPGCDKLNEKVKLISPNYHIFGHIHFNSKYEKEGVTYINASQKLGKLITPNIQIFEL